MDPTTFGNVVGFVLAILFALVIGVSMWALLVGEYMNTFMNEQTRHTVRIVGFAGALAALVTWWVQNFAAQRGFLVRFMFAFFVFVVAFCSFGGLLRFIYIHAAYPSQQDWSLTGMYLASLNDFYTFILDMFLPPRPAYAALTVAAAIYIAWFGPRQERTEDRYETAGKAAEDKSRALLPDDSPHHYGKLSQCGGSASMAASASGSSSR